MAKSPDAFRTISEVAEWLDRPAHVLRFWESKFTQVKPVKRAGGRRYYRRQDMLLLGGIKKLLHDDGMTIKGVQKLLRDNGVKHVTAMSQALSGEDDAQGDAASAMADTVNVDDAQASAQDAAAGVGEGVGADNNLVPFPSAAGVGTADDADTEAAVAEQPTAPTKKKPPFEREPEQALLFEVADSIAPELDDRYLADPDAVEQDTPEEVDVPLPFGDTDTVAQPVATQTSRAAAAPLFPELTPKPGVLSALTQPNAGIDTADLSEVCHLKARLSAQLKALRAAQ